MIEFVAYAARVSARVLFKTSPFHCLNHNRKLSARRQSRTGDERGEFHFSVWGEFLLSGSIPLPSKHYWPRTHPVLVLVLVIVSI